MGLEDSDEAGGRWQYGQLLRAAPRQRTSRGVLLCLTMALVALRMTLAQMPVSAEEALHPPRESVLSRSVDARLARKSVVTAEDIVGSHPRRAPASGREGLDEIYRRLHDLVDEEEHADAGAWEKDVSGLQQRVVAMFYHAYDNYMLHAFPHDELLPLSCHYVDNFGSYALTLIDSLDLSPSSLPLSLLSLFPSSLFSLFLFLLSSLPSLPSLPLSPSFFPFSFLFSLPLSLPLPPSPS